MTMWGKFVRRRPISDFDTDRVATLDDDELTLLTSREPPGGPILLLLHGLEGGAHSHYVAGIWDVARSNGWQPRMLLFRTCDGRLNRARRTYHSGETSDLEDFVGGVDYRYDFGGRVGLMISGDVYEGTWDRAYRDFEDNFGDEIEHRATLEIDSFTAGVVVDLAGERAPVVPYVGAGAGLYSYRLEESGDFIDFTDPDAPIFGADLVTEGETFGYYFLAGLEVPIGPYFSLFGEGRWDNAEDELSEDFDGFGDIDLSGRRIMGGVAWRF